MSSSKGRDKICAFIQYCAAFYYVCVEHTNIPQIEEMNKYCDIFRLKNDFEK